MKIDCVLQKDRRTLGTALIETTAGVFHARCLGKSDNAAATAHENPLRDPLRPFGDTPTGVYEAVLTVVAGGTKQTAAQKRSYGPNKRLVLNAVSGDALQAKKNGRFGEMAHGGDPAANGGLRPTDGCIRFDDDTMVKIIAAYTEPFPFTVSEV